MPVRIHLAGHLGTYTGKNVEVDVPRAKDVLELLMLLSEMFPMVRDRILDEYDRTRPYVNIFVNEENIRDLRGEMTRVRDGDVVYILPSVAGGSERRVSESLG